MAAQQDTVRIMCPKLTCRKILAVPGSARGRTVRCRNCGTTIKVPAEGGPPKGGAMAEGAAAPPDGDIQSSN